jgi:hypothetical protein
MKVHNSAAIGSIFFAILGEPEPNILVVAHGWDQIDELSAEIGGKTKSSVRKLVQAFANVPERAPRPVERYEGSFVSMMAVITDCAMEVATKSGILAIAGGWKPTVVTAMGTEIDSLECDLLISYCGPKNDHHIVILSSWEQYEEVINSLTWIGQAERLDIRARIAQHMMPNKSERPPIRIDGEFPRVFNVGCLALKAFRKQGNALLN